MKTLLRIFSCLLLVGLGGCLPEERFWWSPDGSRAVVVANDQLYLTTAGGELKEPLSSELNISGDLPRNVSWLPDGSGIVVQRTIKRKTWDEARELVPTDEAKEVEQYALAMPHLLSAAVAMSGDRGVADALVAITPNQDKTLATAAFFSAMAKNRTALESSLQASLKGAEFLAEVGGQSMEFEIHEICLVRLKNDRLDGEPVSLVRSLRPVVVPKLSPKFPVVAYWRVLNDQKSVGLMVCTLDGKQRLDVGSTNNTAFDWTADGRSLVFAAPVSDEDGVLQQIRKATVVPDSGGLAEKVEPVNMAVAIMTDPPRLCALPDGRVLFASQPAILPAASEGFNLDPRLFAVSADGKAVSAIPTAPGDLPTNLSFFVASPDGKRIAVVESDTDAVAVVELATGKTDIVSPAHRQWHCRTLPAWKSASELTFAGLSSPTGNPQWMLWTQGGGVKSISEKWPADATRDWLEKKEEQKSSP